jgi:phosphoribosylanthranilate isomerase
MTWVKLCGMSRRRDVELAVRLGVDAVGFVTDPRSPRFVTPEQAGRLGNGIGALRYLVTVDLATEGLLTAAAAAGVDGVQPHGRSSAAAAEAALDSGYRVLFPVPVATGVDLSSVPEGAVPILDTSVPGRHGGTGRSFDWALAAGVGHDYVLAGGLRPDNVGAAIAELDPWGVDVSSGVERVPGEKDAELMERFMEAMQ